MKGSLNLLLYPLISLWPTVIFVWLRVQYRFPDHYWFVSPSLVNYKRAFAGKYDGVSSVFSYLHFFYFTYLFKRDCLYYSRAGFQSQLCLYWEFITHGGPSRFFSYTKTAIQSSSGVFKIMNFLSITRLTWLLLYSLQPGY